ncbi:choice-of-anchor M domain-containing protein [Boudabousia marimammalium]|uniref:SLH domain-containing protein n=1 Tax=Boudabousia marimammalium TaxID=156892 RepID=A0A1Q5PKF2_9ACTO|nr:choice-of-anchor M domain-containing protein [Boudabousia marimammalium]OKL46699.1 hypothetical protein BM477_07020 [Boudabousia marimammalium]
MRPQLKTLNRALIAAGVTTAFILSPMVATSLTPGASPAFVPAAHASVDDQAGNPGDANYNKGKFVATRRHVDSPKVFATETGGLVLKNEVGDKELRPLDETVNWVGKGYARYKGTQQYQLTVPERTGLEFVGPTGTVVYEAPASPWGNHDPIWSGFGADTKLGEQGYRDDTIALDLLKVDGPGQVQLFAAYIPDADDEDAPSWLTVERLLSSTDDGWNTTRLVPGTHTHNRTTFTRPGRYEITYRAIARDAEGNLVTSPEQVATWQVGGVRPRNDESMPEGWDRTNWIADPLLRYQQHTYATPPEDYTFTLDDYRDGQADGDSNLTSMRFSTGAQKLDGVATIWINGYYLTDLDVVDGKLSVSPTGDHTGDRVDQWNELLGSGESKLQISFVPSDPAAGSWFSAPISYRHGQGEVVTTSAESNGSLHPRIPDPGNVEFNKGEYQPTDYGFAATVKPGTLPHTYQVQICATDPKMRFFVRGGFYDEPDDQYPSTQLSGNSTSVDGCYRYQDDDREWNELQGTYPKFHIYPHPEMKAEATEVKFTEPYNLEDALTQTGKFGGAEDDAAEQPTEPTVETPEKVTPEASPEATPETSPEANAPGAEATPETSPEQQQKRLVINNGHLDILGKVVDGKTQISLRDDSLTAANDSVVRKLDDVILAVGNNARASRPDNSGPAYDVLGPKGSHFFWLPQTQQDGIVWPGYNTEGVDYSQLEDGLNLNFKIQAAPEGSRFALISTRGLGDDFALLLDSAKKDFSVETEFATHAHFGWLFSKPGFYQFELSYSGTLNDGSALKPQKGILRFAVGRDAVAEVKDGVWPTLELIGDDPVTPEDSAVTVESPESTQPTAEATPEVAQEIKMAEAEAPAKSTFKDVWPSRPFAGEIEWMAEQKYSTGYKDKTYRPLNSVNRDAMAAFLYRLAGSPKVNLERPAFKDVAKSNQFYKEIQWMAESKISTGWDDGTYRPWKPVSREAMAAFLYRFCDQMPEKCASAINPDTLDFSGASAFPDVAGMSMFEKEIKWLATAKVTSGWQDGTFRPRLPIQRDAMAAFVYRMTHNFLGPVK